MCAGVRENTGTFFLHKCGLFAIFATKNDINKYKQSINSTVHIPEFKGVNSGGDELITLSHKDVKKSYIRADGVCFAIVDEPDIVITINSNGWTYGIVEVLTERVEDYSFDTYVEHFLKTFPFLDKVASIFIEILTQVPAFSEAPEYAKIFTFLDPIAKFLQFIPTARLPSPESYITVCSSDLSDILFKKMVGDWTETEETPEFVFLAPKCHNLRDAFYFFADLQG